MQCMGYIFEDWIIKFKDKSEILNPLINSLLTNNHLNLIILGSFTTHVELFPELINLWAIIDVIENNTFPNDNSILLLVDAFYNNNVKLEYGIKTFKKKASYHSEKKRKFIFTVL